MKTGDERGQQRVAGKPRQRKVLCTPNARGAGMTSDGSTGRVASTTVAAVAVGLGVGIGVYVSRSLRVSESYRARVPGDPASTIGAAAVAPELARPKPPSSAPCAGVKPRAIVAVEQLGPPIAKVHSCFSRRNGTPRQGGDLVPSARCVLTLAPGLPRDLLSGMDEYTHVLIIYVFHANTNDGDTRNGGAVKAKVRVPRLDGKTVGALATRTPHRPLPIGLSLGRVVSVDARAGTLTLAGADLVDGTPVLDIKPYVPFCDRVEDATAPAWVGKEASDGNEPLKISRVDAANGADDAVAAAYVRSVADRRRVRLAREANDASTSSGGKGHKAGGTRTHRGKDGEDAAKSRFLGLSEEEKKATRKEEKDRRRAGLAPPDALYPSGEAFVEMVREVLALDMRTVRERRAPPERRKFQTYRVTLCDVEVEYSVDDETKVCTMLGGAAVKPLDRPGETKRDESRGGAVADAFKDIVAADTVD